MTKDFKYKVFKDLLFEVESEGIKLYDLKAKSTDFIAYPEALVWDMLAREEDMNQIRKAFTLLTRLDEAQVEKDVNSIIGNWLNMKYLIIETNG